MTTARGPAWPRGACASSGVALAGGEDQVGPVLGYSIPVQAALAVAAVAVVLRLALNLAVVQASAGLSAVVRSEQRRLVAHARPPSTSATRSS